MGGVGVGTVLRNPRSSVERERERRECVGVCVCVISGDGRTEQRCRTVRVSLPTWFEWRPDAPPFKWATRARARPPSKLNEPATLRLPPPPPLPNPHPPPHAPSTSPMASRAPPVAPPSTGLSPASCRRPNLNRHFSTKKKKRERKENISKRS